MSNWQYASEVPTLQYRSANTLPREIGLFKDSDGQIYASSVPSPELLKMRGKLSASASNKIIGTKAGVFSLPSDNSGICEIVASIDALRSDSVTLELTNNVGDMCVMTYNPAEHTFSFDRTKSGIVDFSESFPAVTVAPTHESDGTVSLRIYVDRSSVEIFGNDGRFSMTNLVFPNSPYTTLSISARGGKARLDELKIYALNPAHGK